MKKSLIFVSIAAATLFVSASVYAAVITQDGTTHLVTVDGTNVPGGNDIEFSPSTNVIFGGASSETSFLYASYHSGVDQKASGKQFAMAADSTKVFWRDISETSVQTFSATDTTSSSLDGDWNSQ